MLRKLNNLLFVALYYFAEALVIIVGIYAFWLLISFGPKLIARWLF
jgi:hypothetical protein